MQDFELRDTAKHTVADLMTGEFVRQRVDQRKTPQALQFFARDHDDTLSGRKWNQTARQALMVFLSSERSEMEEVVEVTTVSRQNVEPRTV